MSCIPNIATHFIEGLDRTVPVLNIDLVQSSPLVISPILFVRISDRFHYRQGRDAHRRRDSTEIPADLTAHRPIDHDGEIMHLRFLFPRWRAILVDFKPFDERSEGGNAAS